MGKLSKRIARRGATVAQFAVIAALIAVIVIVAVRRVGTNASTSINTTAGNVGDPSSLPARFGS